MKFRREWLARHRLPADECRVIQVLGESMEPTLVDGCSILVNQASRRRRVGRIFVVRNRGRARRQARRQGPRRRLAARQRQPQQAGLADRALARRRARDRRGQVGRPDVPVRNDGMASTTGNINDAPLHVAGTATHKPAPTTHRATQCARGRRRRSPKADGAFQTPADQFPPSPPNPKSLAVPRRAATHRPGVRLC